MKRRACTVALLAVASLGDLLDDLRARLERAQRNAVLRDMRRRADATFAAKVASGAWTYRPRQCDCDPDLQCGVCAPWGHA